MRSPPFPCLAAAAATLLLAAGGATAMPRIERLAATPSASRPGEVAFSVTIERPTPLDIRKCELSVDPGDGSKPRVLTYNIGERRTKTFRHVYARGGSFQVKATGTGEAPCLGARELTVSPGATGRRLTSPKCPAGWSLVEDSVEGERFTCRADPPATPIACPRGTKYFSRKGEIGCR